MASTLRLNQGRRKADLPKLITWGRKRLLMPENSLPVKMADFARLNKDVF
ncbi:MAG: hypothetical protein RL761_1654 [Pseudomonadota bacterium]